MPARRLLLALAGAVVAAGVVGVIVVARGRGAGPAPAPTAATAADAAGAAGTAAGAREGGRDAAAPAGSGAPGRVRRLAAEERRQLGAQIAASRRAAREAAARAAAARGEPPPSDDAVVPLEQAGAPLKAALQESIALLAECYRQLPGGAAALQRATALMTMTSDPELGTVIDTGAIRGPDGRPLDAAIDTCMRDTIDALALPPLGAGGKLELQYTFRFD